MNLKSGKLISVAFVLALAAVSTPALSQDAGWYGGISFGQSKAKDACTGLVGLGITCDDTDTALTLFGGYQINKSFGAELGYVNLGEVSATGPGGTATIEAKGFELVGVGTLPINQQFSLFGKLGFFRWDLDASAPGVSISESGMDLTYGFGVKYDFTKNFAVRAYWQQYKDVGDEATTGTSDVEVIGLSAVFKF